MLSTSCTLIEKALSGLGPSHPLIEKRRRRSRAPYYIKQRFLLLNFFPRFSRAFTFIKAKHQGRSDTTKFTYIEPNQDKQYIESAVCPAAAANMLTAPLKSDNQHDAFRHCPPANSGTRCPWHSYHQPRRYVITMLNDIRANLSSSYGRRGTRRAEYGRGHGPEVGRGARHAWRLEHRKKGGSEWNNLVGREKGACDC